MLRFPSIIYHKGVKLIFTGGHISLTVAFKGQNVISTQQLRISYIDTALKLFRPFEGNHRADVAPSENEFDTPDLSSIKTEF